MREGYPLEREDGNESAQPGVLFPTPSDKTFHLPHGRGEVSVPSGQNPERKELAMEATALPQARLIYPLAIQWLTALVPLHGHRAAM